MIILIGFPKSGTSSFQKLFKNLGYNSYHYKKNNKFIGNLILQNKQKKKPLLNDFLENDVITQMDVCVDKNNAYWPQLIDYKQLYYENQNSIFILNKRDPKNLLSSFKRWNNYHGRLITYNPELLNNKSDQSFIDFVNKHYTDVETFFLQYPDAKFMTFDIEKDNVEKLKKYIDLKNITIFPHENKNNKK